MPPPRKATSAEARALMAEHALLESWANAVNAEVLSWRIYALHI